MSSVTPEPATDQEAQTIQSFLKQGGHVEVREIEAIKAESGALVTVDKPGVMSFPTTLDHLSSAALAGLTRRATIELELDGLGPSDRASAAVFLNNSTASRQTSFEHPSFAGAVSFFVNPMQMAASAVMTESFLYEIDITTVVKRLGKASGPVTASVVLQPLPKASFPNGLAIKSSRLRVLDSTVKRSS